MKKKSPPVLLVIDHFGSGGAQRQIVAIANGLVAEGHEIHIFVYYPEFDHHRSTLDSRVLVIEADKTSKSSFGVILTLFLALYKYRYKSAMAFLHTPAFYLELASFFYLGNLRLYYSERSSVGLGKKGLFSWIKKKMHCVCDEITSNSIVQTKILGDYYGHDMVSYIPNAMPEDLFKVDVTGAAYKHKNIVVLSHTRAFKNFRYVADALIEYQKIYKKKPTIINWYGEIYYSSELEEVQDMMKSNDLADYLVFHGVVSDVKEILNEAYFLLHPSKYESSSNAVAEALVTGTPVLLGDIADHKDIVASSSAGYIVSLNRPCELAEKLHQCESLSFDDYLNFCNNAHSFACNNYKSEVIVHQYQKLLC